MIRWFKDKLLTRRALRYLRTYPDDYPTYPIISMARGMGVTNARVAAEMGAGREFTDVEWKSIELRWERPWAAMVFGKFLKA